jgi:hypothetical protein
MRRVGIDAVRIVARIAGTARATGHDARHGINVLPTDVFARIRAADRWAIRLPMGDLCAVAWSAPRADPA